MSAFGDALRGAQSLEELQPLLARIPYARFLGFSVERDGDDLVGRMAFRDTHLGNAVVRALHGGTLGAMMELTALSKLLVLPEVERVPKTVNLTIEYLRPGAPKDVLARATVIRHGRRVAAVRVIAWQDDPAKPIAAANLHFLLAA
ncbi:MAG TPA: PaaI family thioesterase [Nevskiaceae bacterium]|nr:PaaI family thioesterase [Nevskiaceae bacterium]